MKRKSIIYSVLIALVVLTITTSCSKSKSYSELLRTEEKACNWFLAQHKVETAIPTDSIFQTGEEAPYYRMDEDGYVYMQVLKAGDRNNMAKKDQMIYFRYMRVNVEEMYEGLNPEPTGNANNVGTGNATGFRFDNTELPSTLAYGSGLQVPLKYLGLDCEVNLLIRSYYGIQSELGACQPYLYQNVKYFPAQY